MRVAIFLVLLIGPLDMLFEPERWELIMIVGEKGEWGAGEFGERRGRHVGVVLYDKFDGDGEWIEVE